MLLYACSGRVGGGSGAVVAGGTAGLCAASGTRHFHCNYGVRLMATQQTVIELRSTITCPDCGHVETETMPTDACQWFYDCKGCGALLKPKQGDCCVYCSHATVPCPPIQEGGSCC